MRLKQAPYCPLWQAFISPISVISTQFKERMAEMCFSLLIYANSLGFFPAV